MTNGRDNTKEPGFDEMDKQLQKSIKDANKKGDKRIKVRPV